MARADAKTHEPAPPKAVLDIAKHHLVGARDKIATTQLSGHSEPGIFLVRVDDAGGTPDTARNLGSGTVQGPLAPGEARDLCRRYAIALPAPDAHTYAIVQVGYTADGAAARHMFVALL